MATDPATVSATARTSWNARTKERSRARFLIRQRLQASVNASYSASASADEPSNHIECLDVGEASTALVGAAATTKTQGGSIIISSYTTDAIDRAAERDMRLGCLGAVESWSVAKFSLRYMEMHRDVEVPGNALERFRYSLNRYLALHHTIKVIFCNIKMIKYTTSVGEY